MPVQGDYGTENNPYENLWQDKVRITPLTSDPANHSEGDRWLRVDLDSGDRLATMRFDSGGSVWDVPVFPLGSSSSGVIEERIVETPNGTGYIPLVQNGGAFSAMRYQHNGTWYGWHNDTVTTRIIESFEDGDISEYSGDTGQFAVNSDFATDGSLGLDIQASDGFTYIWAPATEFSETAGPGETIRASVSFDATSNHILGTILAADGTTGSFPDDAYRLMLEQTGEVQLTRRSGGANSTAAINSSVSINSGRYDIEFNWSSDGGLEFGVWDGDMESGEKIASLTYLDSSVLTTEGLGFEGNQSDGTGAVDGNWDNIRQLGSFDFDIKRDRIQTPTFDSNNPILTGGSQAWEASSVSDPSVRRESGTYYLYYGSSSNSGVATSSDGVSFTKSSNNPLLTSGNSGEWDAGGRYQPDVVKADDGTYYMFFSGTDGNGLVQIGVASSSSPDSGFTAYSGNPILSPGSSGTWEEADVYAPTVWVENGTWHMLYIGQDSNQLQLAGHATASGPTDTWTKDSNNPVTWKGPDNSWRSDNNHHLDIDIIDGTYHLVQVGRDGGSVSDVERIGHVWGDEIGNWTYDPENPYIEPGNTGSWASDDVGEPTFIYDSSASEYKTYFAGSDSNGVLSIGLAHMPTNR